MDHEYPPPVARLIKLGKPVGEHWRSYSVIGITVAHVPDLVHILRSPEFDLLDGEDPGLWAPVHARRALAELREFEVVRLLLGRLDEFTDDDWDDWVYRDFSQAVTRVGPPALEPLVAYLNDPARQGPNSLAVSSAIAAIAKEHAETRPAARDALVAAIENWRRQPPDHNSGLITALVDLRVQEAMPVIREAMEAGSVDELLIGSVDWVEYDMGLRDRPPTNRYLGTGLGLAATSGDPTKRNARERATARRKQAKASKKRNRRK